MSDTSSRLQHHQTPDKAHALSFGRAVSEYDRGRPEYPDEAVRWILDQVRSAPDGVDAVDIGAGTGKFTRALVSAGARVTAVEPIPEMRERLAANLPGIALQQGTAESTRLPDASADLVTFAQSWHWVDVVPASAEIARILRPEGVLALIWNVREDTSAWLARLGEIVGASVAEEYDSIDPALGAPLARSDYAEFRWSTTLDRDELFAMITSRSYIITMPPDERARMLADLTDLLDTHPDVAGAERFTIPYVTRVTIATAD